MPNALLTEISREYPGAWGMAEGFRSERAAGLRRWPAWCYLPSPGWAAIAGVLLDKRPTTMDASEIALLPVLAALGAWRWTQGIYRFHPELLAELVKTKLTGDIPADVLLRLPEWCVYIEAGLEFFGLPIKGFFAFHDYESGGARLGMLMLVGDKGVPMPVLPIPLGEGPLEDVIRKSFDRYAGQANAPEYLSLPDAAKAGAEVLYPFISILLYLCADEPEIAGHVPGEHPAYPKPVKTKKGLKLFPPDKPRVWHVGYPTGEKLQRARETAASATQGEQSARRAHIRRAHWHGYWTGPKKPKEGLPPEKQERRFSYRWLHPMIISGSG